MYESDGPMADGLSRVYWMKQEAQGQARQIDGTNSYVSAYEPTTNPRVAEECEIWTN
jgi:hypothetical protein